MFFGLEYLDPLHGSIISREGDAHTVQNAGDISSLQLENQGKVTVKFSPSFDLIINRTVVVEFEAIGTEVKMFLLNSHDKEFLQHHFNSPYNSSVSSSNSSPVNNSLSNRLNFAINSNPIRSNNSSFSNLSSSNSSSNLASSSKKLEVKIPWMKTYKYPMIVYIYAFRKLLKLPNLESWQASILLSKEFYEIPQTFLTEISLKNHIQSNLQSNPNRLKVHVSRGRGQGRRPYMEDTDCYFPQVKLNSNRQLNIFGIFDGHGGYNCSHYLSDYSSMKIIEKVKKNSYISFPQMMSSLFNEIDTEFMKNNNMSGSTACLLIYDNSHHRFYIGNIGDTRAILIRKGKNISSLTQALPLTLDRKASDPEEIARITHAGGFVVNGRVLGSLAVSRAVGDKQFKANDEAKKTSLTLNTECEFDNNLIVVPEVDPKSHQKIVICDPEITSFEPSPADLFIVVATDGLWDVMTSDEVNQFIVEKLRLKGIEISSLSDSPITSLTSEVLNSIAQELVSHSIEVKKSNDNVTAMILFLEHLPSSSSSPTSSSYFSNENSPSISPSSSMNDLFYDSKPSFNSNSNSISRPPSFYDKSNSNSSSIYYISENKSASNTAPSSKSSNTFSYNSYSSKNKIIDDDDDELMKFLTDDSNF